MAARTPAPAPAAGLIAEVGREGLAIPYAAFRARVGGEAPLRRVLATLTVTERLAPGRPKGAPPAKRRAWEVRGETLFVPRQAARAFLRAGCLDGVRPAPDAPPAPRRLDPEACECAGEMYDYQQTIVDFLCDDAGPFGPPSRAAAAGQVYLQLATGLGKSLIGCAVLARLGAPGLVVVPTQAIAEQWVETLAEFFPGLTGAVFHNPPPGRRRPPPGPATHDMVVVIVNTFRGKDPAFLDGFGLVVLDEAHEYHSPCNARALWLAQTPAVLGLSATPLEREDRLDRYVPLHLGPVLRPETIPGFDTGSVSFRGEVRIVEYAGAPAFCETVATPAGTMSAVLTIGRVVADPARLRLVAAEVERLCGLHETAPPAERARLGLGPRPPGAATPALPAGEVRRHGVLVFAELRDYLPALRDALLERFAPGEILVPDLDEEGGGAPAPPPDKVSVLRGGGPRGAVSAARDAGAHIVLTTYGFSRRGVSLPDMTAVVLATPRRHGMRQILGRILRRGSDESILRQVVDIVDVHTGLKSQVSDRRKIYREKDYPISKVAVAWDAFATAAAAPPAGSDAAEEEEDELAALSDEALLALALGTA